MKQQFLEVGKITNVHGLMGEVRVQPWADSDVNSAMAMRNAILYIDRKDAHLPEGSFFLADVMGMEVRDAKTGEILGNIADVLTLPANNVYVVRGGAREILIPAVDEFVAEVDLDGSCMRVNMVEGL